MMDMNLDHIKALADLANEKNLAEIKVESGDACITIKTPAAFPAQTTVMAGGGGVAPAVGGFALPAVAAPKPPVAADSASVVAAAPAAASAVAVPSGHMVTSPMVGTFYRSPSPESPPFAEVGTVVKVGQPLCIIEAMKLMNELECDIAGKVIEVLVENGQPVEYGQALFRVDPA
jgi:acetyl-CoA carboxylase biotin carboxyl carrier protein